MVLDMTSPSALPRAPGHAPESGSRCSSEDLAAQVARGDRAAFAELHDRICGPVYGIVSRVLRDGAQAEEIAQEVLLQAWTSAARFDPAKGSATARIMTIAHRRAVDRVRHEQRTRARHLRLAAVDHSVEYDTVAECVEQTQERDAVRAYLGSHRFAT